MNKSSKLSLHQGIIDVNLVENNLSIYLLELIRKDTYNFDVKYVDSEQVLRDFYTHHIHSSIEEKLSQKPPSGDTICGYNNAYIPLIISGASVGNGMVQLIDDKLVYFPNGIRVSAHRDSYLFAYNHDRIYTNVTPMELVKGLVDIGYPLFFKDGTNSLKSEFGIYNLTQQDKPTDLKKITIDSIDAKLFE